MFPYSNKRLLSLTHTVKPLRQLPVLLPLRYRIHTDRVYKQQVQQLQHNEPTQPIVKPAVKPRIQRKVLTDALFFSNYTPDELTAVIQQWLQQYTLSSTDIHSIMALCHKNRMFDAALQTLQYCIPYQQQALLKAKSQHKHTTAAHDNDGIAMQRIENETQCKEGELLTVIAVGMFFNIAAQCQRHDIVTDLLHNAHMYNLPLNTVIWNTALKSSNIVHQYDQTIQLFHTMKAKGYIPDTYSYNNAIHACAQSKQWLLAIDLLEHIQAEHQRYEQQVQDVKDRYKQIEHEIVNHTGVYTRSEDGIIYDKQKNIIPSQHTAISQVTPPVHADAITYNTALNACSVAGQHQTAMTVFNTMIERGFEPTVRTYNQLITAYARNGQIDDALQVYQQIKKINLKPTLITYSCVINGLYKARRYDECRRMYQSLIDAGFVPDIVLYTTMLNITIAQSDFKGMMALLHSLLKHNVNPDAHMISFILTALRRKAQPEQCEAVLNLLTHKIPNYVPGVDIYALALDACNITNDYTRFQRIYQQFEKHRKQYNWIYTVPLARTLITMLDSQKQHAVVLSIVNELNTSNSVYGTLWEDVNAAIVAVRTAVLCNQTELLYTLLTHFQYVHRPVRVRATQRRIESTTKRRNKSNSETTHMKPNMTDIQLQELCNTTLQRIYCTAVELYVQQTNTNAVADLIVHMTSADIPLGWRILQQLNDLITKLPTNEFKDPSESVQYIQTLCMKPASIASLKERADSA